MRVAALADIHGNADALAAVLADLAGQGVDALVVLGDHFSGPLAAAETWDVLRGLGALCLLGNHDRYLLQTPRAAMGQSDGAAFDELPGAALDWLASLPPTARLGEAFLCHGTPASDETYLCERVTAGGAVTLRDQAAIAGLLAGVEAPLVLCAHSHLPRALRLRDGRLVVNPGSVGCPAYTDGTPVPHVVESGFPEASYALLDRRAAGWDVGFRRVPYDSRRMAALAAGRGRAEWASAVASGWITP